MSESIDLYDMPEERNIEDYPKGTSFTLNENAGPRYDRSAFARGEIIKVYPGEPEYNTALERSELYEMIRQIRE